MSPAATAAGGGRGEAGEVAPVLVSATFVGQPPLPDALPPGVEVRPRASDWRYRGALARARHVVSGLQLAGAGRGRAAVVVAHAGLEAAVAGPLLRLISPRTRLVLLDPLLPTRSRGERVVLAGWRAYHRLLVLRRGDADPIERRAGVPAERIRFVAYPVRPQPEASRAGAHVYAAGNAHRDWPTLVEALRRSGLPAILAGHLGPEVGELPAAVQVRRAVTPEEGRALAADAAVVAAVLRDTELPAGPLVLLDAMAMGQAVVAVDVNGTRDYVRDGVDGVLVRPGDPEALAAALTAVVADPDRARALGAEARRRAIEELSPERFLAAVLDHLAELGVAVAPADPEPGGIAPEAAGAARSGRVGSASL